MPKKFYITTAIHYVNDVPHIGHMYENIVADVIARHRRRMGDDVWFLTGTDEHGQRIERSAARQGILPIELADRVVADHHRLWKKLNISYDDFIRTTEARHRIGVHEIIRRMLERNPDDIYLGEFEGWYCPNDETYFTDKEITDAKCPNGHPLERTRETAAPIARALRLRTHLDRGLLECDFGLWTGKKLHLLAKKPEWRAVQHAPSTFRFPEGESFTELQLRMWTTLERIAAKHRNRTIVVVSHADPIKAAVTYAQGVPLDLFQRTAISTCSISAIGFTNGAPVVLSVNNTDSLKDLAPS